MARHLFNKCLARFYLGVDNFTSARRTPRSWHADATEHVAERSSFGQSIRARVHDIRVDLNAFGYRSILSGQVIYNSGTLIQILARLFNPDTVKTGHCHLKRSELCVKKDKGAIVLFHPGAIRSVQGL